MLFSPSQAKPRFGCTIFNLGIQSAFSHNFIFNIVKSCDRLVPPENARIYLPCFTTFGSSCTLGCVDGYIAFGNNRATCNVTNSSEVAWDIGNFYCKGLCCPLSVKAFTLPILKQYIMYYCLWEITYFLFQACQYLNRFLSLSPACQTMSHKLFANTDQR